jgi:hypothetical protein
MSEEEKIIDEKWVTRLLPAAFANHLLTSLRWLERTLQHCS